MSKSNVVNLSRALFYFEGLYLAERFLGVVVSAGYLQKSFDLLLTHLAVGFHHADNVLNGCVTIFVFIKDLHVALVLVGSIVVLAVLF